MDDLDDNAVYSDDYLSPSAERRRKAKAPDNVYSDIGNPADPTYEAMGNRYYEFNLDNYGTNDDGLYANGAHGPDDEEYSSARELYALGRSDDKGDGIYDMGVAETDVDGDIYTMASDVEHLPKGGPKKKGMPRSKTGVNKANAENPYALATDLNEENERPFWSEGQDESPYALGDELGSGSRVAAANARGGRANVLVMENPYSLGDDESPAAGNSVDDEDGKEDLYARSTKFKGVGFTQLCDFDLNRMRFIFTLC